MPNENIVTESMRIDQFVADVFNISRSQAVKRIEEGCIQCNGEVMKKASKKVKVNDVITYHEKCVILPASRSLGEVGSGEQASVKDVQLGDEGPSPTISILYEDFSCLVINKPAGITVHPARTTKNEPTIIEIMRNQMKMPDLQLVHRLDKDTTGCLLLAKSVEAHEALQKQFKDRTVQKTYLAIVAGVPKEKKATIEAEIGRSLVNRMKMSLFRTSTSRVASTSYEILKASDDIALLRCDLHTGRTHQIRVHLSSIGHPILGDDKYKSEVSWVLSNHMNINTLMLLAESLRFESPSTKKEITISADMAPIMHSIADMI